MTTQPDPLTSIKSIRDGLLRLAQGSDERFPASSARYPEHIRNEIATTLIDTDKAIWRLLDLLDETTYNVLDPQWDEAEIH